MFWFLNKLIGRKKNEMMFFLKYVCICDFVEFCKVNVYVVGLFFENILILIRNVNIYFRFFVIGRRSL